MTKLVWDKMEERVYETGIDHGVLYFPVSGGVVWEGIISIEEDLGGDSTTPGYFDGVKHRDIQKTSDFAATLTAFTYPDEFTDFEGLSELSEGLYVDGQNAKVFGLSYRTLFGGTPDYQLHLLYNLTAIPEDRTYETVSSTPDPLQFQWFLNGVPEVAPHYRPTGHIILDSRYMNDDVLEAIEDIIYGTEVEEPRLPNLSDLISFVLGWNPKIIIPQLVTGLAELVNGQGDLTETKLSGIFTALPETRLVETNIDGLYHLV